MQIKQEEDDTSEESARTAYLAENCELADNCIVYNTDVVERPPHGASSTGAVYNSTEGTQIGTASFSDSILK